MTAPALRVGAVPRQTKFSYGLGLNSAAIALRWLEEPESRDGIDLESVTLVVAMTGDEYDDTRRMTERHLLPRLREHNVRLVQLSRASQSGGYVVLDDSRSPRRMVMRGPWKLSDEFAAAGTLPQLSSHLCSIRSKAEPLDWWAADEYGDQPVNHVVGYAAEEGKRVAKDMERASALRNPVYPLVSCSLDSLWVLHGRVRAWPTMNSVRVGMLGSVLGSGCCIGPLGAPWCRSGSMSGWMSGLISTSGSGRPGSSATRRS
jgi:hypothetical protein